LGGFGGYRGFRGVNPGFTHFGGFVGYRGFGSFSRGQEIIHEITYSYSIIIIHNIILSIISIQGGGFIGGYRPFIDSPLDRYIYVR
jgi:hypothetical protein